MSAGNRSSPRACGNRVHFDVMDSHYVPKPTIERTTAPIDVHPMVRRVDRVIRILPAPGAATAGRWTRPLTMR